jgi:hypothetical protein
VIIMASKFSGSTNKKKSKKGGGGRKLTPQQRQQAAAYLSGGAKPGQFGGRIPTSGTSEPAPF